jgi:ATPase subunit of ABC transporter with duplicated ATPase domains
MQVFLVVCQLLLATPSPAQYVFLDVNGDGLCGGSDVLTNDINAVDIYFDTNHNADGSVAPCVNGGALTFEGYSLVLKATGPGERLGEEVVIAKNVSKGYGDRLLFENLNFALPRGGIVGVIGPNGAGKTTLFRLITGQESPDGGELIVGSTVSLAYVDQNRDALDPDKTVYQEVSGGEDMLQFGKRQVNARAYCSGFNFRGSDQQKKVGLLSGGERNRVHMAKLLKSGGNLILLDEPTNDLDVDTLRALEEALLSFAGCAVVISHDRWFLDRIATHILAFEGDSQVHWFEGNFQDYAADYKRRTGQPVDQPHRVRYKKLVH